MPAAFGSCPPLRHRRGLAPQPRTIARRRGRTGLAALSLLLATGCAEPRVAPDGVLLIVIDTVNTAHLGLNGYHRPTSERLERWAEGGAVFDRAYATSPWTLPSVGSMLTGQLPSTHQAGTRRERHTGPRFGRLEAALPTLAELLAEEGHTTGAIINNAFLHPRFGLARGFDTYDFSPGTQQQLRRADQVVDQAIRWLQQRHDSPFFLLVHLFDPHMVYDPPDSTRGRFSASVPTTGRPRITTEIRAHLRRGEEFDRDYLIALYDEELLFVDQQLGRLFDMLAATGLDERTLVVVTSDHGEELFDRGGFEHGHTLYDELLRIVLIVRGPGVPAGRVDEPVSVVDLLPTIVSATGHRVPEGLPGRSLLRATPEAPGLPRTLLAERPLYGSDRHAIVRWPFKLIADVSGNSVALFDLQADPAERRDLGTDRPEVTEGLRAMLEAAVAAAGGDPPAEADLDDDTLDALRSLGYIR